MIRSEQDSFYEDAKEEIELKNGQANQQITANGKSLNNNNLNTLNLNSLKTEFSKQEQGDQLNSKQVDSNLSE